MGTSGFFAYRHKKKYYRQYLYSDAYPLKPGMGQHLVDTIPRNPTAFKAWIAERIRMLKTVQRFDASDPSGGPERRPDSVKPDDAGYTVTYTNQWTFIGERWSYVIDLDNLALTINGVHHWRLDHLPLDLGDYYGDFSLEHDIPAEHLCDNVDLWPPPLFDTEDRLAKYEALRPIIVPAAEWGAPAWNQLSVAQQFSIEITHHLLHMVSLRFVYAYASDDPDIGKFCWDVLCASVPALPIFQSDKWRLPVRTLVSGFNDTTWPAYRGTPPPTIIDRYDRMDVQYHSSIPYYRDPFKSYSGYFRVRGCLVTFCVQLIEPVYVAHEVEQMVKRIRRGGSSSNDVGIILSSQQELVVVAVDGLQVRHSPVLDIRAVDGVPGRASDGRLLLTHLLSPVMSVAPSPACVPKSSPSSKSFVDLPLEVLRMIIDYADVDGYLDLSGVSRSIRAICVANPRVGDYTVLHKIPGLDMMFAAQSTHDNSAKTIELYWKGIRYHSTEHGKWKFREVPSEELEELKREKNVH